MNRLQAILRGASSVLNFNFNINGNYQPPQIIDIQELPPLRSPGEEIASYWKATGDCMRSAMNQLHLCGDDYGEEEQE
jgi:hypothetical protein